MIIIKIRKTLRGRSGSFSLDLNLRIQTMNTVFFGPSGSGKTLTMRCIAGLAEPDAGIIAVNDTVFFDKNKKICLAPRQRHVGYVPQDYALFPHLNLLQNIAYPRTAGLGRYISAREKARAREIMRRFHLDGLEELLPSALSGGQKQRASLARAMNSKPGLLLLDEPFAALDPLLRTHARHELLDFVRNCKLPAIIISHDPDDVDDFADMLVLYKAGEATGIEDYRQIRGNFSSAAACLRWLEERENF